MTEESLLTVLAERARAASMHAWEPFVAVQLGYRDVVVFHPRMKPLAGATMSVIDALGQHGLLDVARQPSGARVFQITPEGFAAAERPDHAEIASS